MGKDLNNLVFYLAKWTFLLIPSKIFTGVWPTFTPIASGFTFPTQYFHYVFLFLVNVFVRLFQYFISSCIFILLLIEVTHTFITSNVFCKNLFVLPSMFSKKSLADLSSCVGIFSLRVYQANLAKSPKRKCFWSKANYTF